MTGTSSVADLLERARSAGGSDEAIRMLRAAVDMAPSDPRALNALAMRLMAGGDPAEARALLERAVAADGKALPLWLNLAAACRESGDPETEGRALDAALGIDPYCFPALLQKAQLLERAGSLPEAAGLYRNALKIAPDESSLGGAGKAALTHARSFLEREGERAWTGFRQKLAPVYESFPDADFRRASGYAEHLAGKRKVFVNEPTAGHFPYLPAFEYFDRDLFPWFAELEAATPAIRGELLSLWQEQEPGFQPYVKFDPTQPVNQWGELNHSTRWSAWFFWVDGKRDEANCRRCPQTAAVLDRLPLLDIPGKAPTVMFSVLQPRTRIPPHTGSSNVRTTVHLPLVVPPGCCFRVGSDTREWVEGQAWAFDDTIEHEAWNDSDRPRAILILDCWNPLLGEHERAAVRAVS
jgi:aspartate beta-hydroxylase